MIALSAFVLMTCTFSAAFEPNDDLAEGTVHVNESCTPYQTPCGLGCCPFAEATCCSDGFECCQHGQTCIPYIGICIGVEDGAENGLSLVSSKSTPVENLITVCPPGTTTCGRDKCCRYPSATCCSDGAHCCPHGFRCDLRHKQCIRDSSNDIFPTLSKVSYMPAVKAVTKSTYKSCPGSDKICPSYSSCCIADNGQWSCCPKPSLSDLGMVEGDCCSTIFGPRCCPRACTFLGCF